MKKIALIQQGNAYAPELWAYKQFLEKNGFFVKLFKTGNNHDLSAFDVEWHFMGIDRTPKKKGRIKIHEYVSLSVPPGAKWKDWMKKQINVKPDVRIFGRQFVQEKLGFSDGLPSFFRDAALADFFLDKKSNLPKEFDFVYSGSTHKSRKTSQLLEAFIKYLPKQKLLVIGIPPRNTPSRIIHASSIEFSGIIPYQKVPSYLQKARFAINYMPDIYPYNQQRALKLLEYCAVGLPVLTTSYYWVNQFEQKRGGRFFKLEPDLSNMNMHAIESFNYKNPNVTDLVWENVLQNCGIVKWLRGRFGY